MNKLTCILIVLISACATTTPTLRSTTIPTLPQVEINTTPYTTIAVVDNSQNMPRPDNVGGVTAALRRGQAAPFDGVLLNAAAAAYIEAEYHNVQQRCVVDRRADLQRLGALAVRDIQTLQTAYGAQRQSYDIILHSRDMDIHDLQTALSNSQSPWRTILWSAGSFLVGGSLGLGVGVLLGH